MTETLFRLGDKKDQISTGSRFQDSLRHRWVVLITLATVKMMVMITMVMAIMVIVITVIIKMVINLMVTALEKVLGEESFTITAVDLVTISSTAGGEKFVLSNKYKFK